MSGFVGIWRLDGGPVEPAVLSKMSAMLAHCGPDGEGQWVQGPVGMACQLRRVTPESIEETQPLVHSSGAVLVFDGRLDNREELLSMLKSSQRISPKSPDPAFVLAAYDAWGERFAEHLTGEFAIALFDARQHRLLLVRDAIGLRPLYYCRTGTVFLLASQIKAILAHPEVCKRPNDDAVAGFILGGRTLDRPDSTLFQGVFSLLPGHMAWLSPEGLTIRQYWEFSTARRIRCRGFEEYAEGFRHYFSQAVSRHLRSAYPVAVSVSGGLDSSAIICLAADLRQQEPRRHAPVIGFSSTYPEGTSADEKVFLSDIERDFGMVIERIPPIAPGIVGQADDLVWHAEGPFLSGLGTIWDALMRRAQRAGARVLLTGLWGDQVLFDQAYLMDLLGQGAWIKIWQHLNEYGRWFGGAKPNFFRRLFLHDVLRSLIPDSILPWLRGFRRGKILSGAHVWYTDAFQARALRCAVHGALPRGSFASAHARAIYLQTRSPFHVLNMEGSAKLGPMYGLDMTFPFLDRDLVSFLMCIPGDMQTWKGIPKALLRQSLRGVLPESIAGRREKADFTDFHNQGTSRDLTDVVQQLRTGMAVDFGYLDAHRLQCAFSRLSHDMRNARGALLGWAIRDMYALEVWLQVYFGEGSSKPRNLSPILQKGVIRRIRNHGQEEARSRAVRDRIGTTTSPEKIL